MSNDATIGRLHPRDIEAIGTEVMYCLSEELQAIELALAWLLHQSQALKSNSSIDKAIDGLNKQAQHLKDWEDEERTRRLIVAQVKAHPPQTPPPSPVAAQASQMPVSQERAGSASNGATSLPDWQASAVAEKLVDVAGALATSPWIASNEIAPRLSAVRRALVAELLALNGLANT